MKVIILGGGGRMAHGIVMDFLLYDTDEIAEIVLADLDVERAQKEAESWNDVRVKARYVDAGDLTELTGLLHGYDVLINAGPPFGELPSLVLQAALAAGIPSLSLGAAGRDGLDSCMALDEDFKKAGVCAVEGLGSSPGTMNLIARAVGDKLDTVESFSLSFAYASLAESSLAFKIPFLGALWEFSTCPVVFREGNWETLPPMSLLEDVNFPDPIGARRCFAIGHPEVFTLPLYFKEKGLREVVFKAGFAPRFYEQGKFLAEAGLAGTEPVTVSGVDVVPMDVTETCAANLGPDAGDIVDHGILRAIATGTRGPDRLKITAMLKSRPYKGLTGVQHRTGVPPAIGARLLARGGVTKHGVFTPEFCIDPPEFFREMARRQLEVELTETAYL